LFITHVARLCSFFSPSLVKKHLAPWPKLFILHYLLSDRSPKSKDKCQRSSYTVFTSRNVTEMSKTIEKAEIGKRKPAWLPISHLSVLASARQVSAFT